MKETERQRDWRRKRKNTLREQERERREIKRERETWETFFQLLFLFLLEAEILTLNLFSKRCGFSECFKAKIKRFFNRLIQVIIQKIVPVSIS